MPQSTNLIDTLKHALRAQRITYKDIALTLELSEASIKNMFSTCNISLKRLDAICQMMGMGFTDLVRMMDENQERISHLSRESIWRIEAAPSILPAPGPAQLAGAR